MKRSRRNRSQACRWKTFVLIAGGLASAFEVSASIAPGTTGNGELFLSVFDSGAKVSYTLDLGMRMDTFFVTAQQDDGAQFFWLIDQATDGEWSKLLNATSNPAALRWSVLAFDSTGPNATVGAQRLFTTSKQGDEAKISTFTNAAFTNGIGATQAGTFFNAINTTGTHPPAAAASYDPVNGSSFNADPSAAYFGHSGSTGPTLNGNAPFNNSNLIGQSSWFYYLTRSGSNQLGTVVVDEFDNIGTGNAGDGYFGFIYVDPALYPDAPAANLGKWLLSYTLLSATPTVAALQFAKTIARTETSSGGYAVQVLPGVATTAAATDKHPSALADVIETPAGFASHLITDPGLTRIGASLPVPEPRTDLLALAGLAALAVIARRRQSPKAPQPGTGIALAPPGSSAR
jgi:hypothetical protein